MTKMDGHKEQTLSDQELDGVTGGARGRGVGKGPVKMSPTLVGSAASTKDSGPRTSTAFCPDCGSDQPFTIYQGAQGVCQTCGYRGMV